MVFLSRRSIRFKVVHFLVICPFRQSQKLVSLLTKARLETRKNEKRTKSFLFICLLQIPNFLHRSSKKKSFQKPKKEITGCCTDHSKANRAVTAASCCQLLPAAAICRPRLEIKPPPFCIICKGEGFCFVVFFAPKETFFLKNASQQILLVFSLFKKDVEVQVWRYLQCCCSQKFWRF